MSDDSKRIPSGGNAKGPLFRCGEHGEVFGPNQVCVDGKTKRESCFACAGLPHPDDKAPA